MVRDPIHYKFDPHDRVFSLGTFYCLPPPYVRKLGVLLEEHVLDVNQSITRVHVISNVNENEGMNRNFEIGVKRCYY